MATRKNKKKKTSRRILRRTRATDRRQRLDRGPPTPRRDDDDFTIDEWCAKRRISKVHFYKLLKLGLAPRTKKLLKRRTISPEADAEWQAERERATAAAA
jgi:hypothetical protein